MYIMVSAGARTTVVTECRTREQLEQTLHLMQCILLGSVDTTNETNVTTIDAVYK